MKKILLIIMLLFSSLAFADNQYTVVNENVSRNGGIWILDNKNQKLLFWWHKMLAIQRLGKGF